MFTLLQELLVTHLLIIMTVPLQPKIRTMTAINVTVLTDIKEPGGTGAVMNQTSMVIIIMGGTHRLLMEYTGIPGEVTTTL